MKMAESLCTCRMGRSSANQRSPPDGADGSAGRWRDAPCGPAIRSMIAAPIRPRIRSAAPEPLIYLLLPRVVLKHFRQNGPLSVTSDTFSAFRP
jgi:hypothetical protein